MIVLDENITKDQAQLLRRWNVRHRQVGVDVGHPGVKDHEIIALLHRLARPTLFTRDSDFFGRQLCHPDYCLVYLEVGIKDTAVFVRRLLRHASFNTNAKRMGTMLHVGPTRIVVRRFHQDPSTVLDWILARTRGR